MENKKHRVLIVHNYYQIPGGEDTVVANEKQMLEENGHEVFLYTRNNSELKEMRKLQKLLLPVTTIFNLRTYKEIRSIIRENHINIVHIHNTLSLISPSVYYAANSCKVPVVQTIHNFRLLCPGATFYRNGHICEDCLQKGLNCAVKHNCYRGSKLQTLACAISMKIHKTIGIYGKINYICLTKFNKEKLLNLKSVQANRIFVKPNFVKPMGEFISVEQRENQFVYAGRLDRLKGIDILFNAWKLMADTAPKLVVYGIGPMEKWCKDFISRNKVNIEMRGFISNTQVRDVIANSKALVLPTQWYEGFPMSIVEAFSVGTPVVCSNLGNAGSLVVEGVSGTKFKCDSAVELSEAIKRINQYKYIYETTKGTYLENYTEECNYECLYGVYTNLDGNM